MQRLPGLGQLLPAAPVAEMRQQVDRRIGEEVDVVGAERERALGVARIEGLEEFENGLARRIVGHGAQTCASSAAAL